MINFKFCRNVKNSLPLDVNAINDNLQLQFYLIYYFPLHIVRIIYFCQAFPFNINKA